MAKNKRKATKGATETLCDLILKLDRIYPGETDADMNIDPDEWEMMVSLSEQISGKKRAQRHAHS